MQVSIDDAEEDYGTLVVHLERDDSASLGGYGNNMTLRLPLYAHEAQAIIDALTPIASAGEEEDPFRDAENCTDCPECGSTYTWNSEDKDSGLTCACGHVFTDAELEAAPSEEKGEQ